MRLVFCAAAAIFALCIPARAEGMPHQCRPLDEAFKAVMDAGGKIIEVGGDQRVFLEGVYAMSPETPVGLPLGDRVFLGEKEGNDMAVVLFVDDAKACDLMQIPKELVILLGDVGAKIVMHEDGGL